MNKLNGNFTGKNDSHSTKKGSIAVHFFAHWRVAVPILIALLTFGILFAALGNGELVRASVATNVQGTIITDTVWILAESPYVVTGDVIVNPDITLTIEPGVKVAFDGNFAIFVNGTLEAIGTETAPIRFTSNKASPSPGDWGMIDFRDSSMYNVLEHSVIEYGGNDSRAGVGCWSGALCVSTSSFALSYSTVQHNATRGLVLRQSDAIINNNTFTDHPYEAIRLHSCNHNIGPCRPSIIENDFSQNANPVYRAGAMDPYIHSNQADDNDLNGLVFATPCTFFDDNTWYADDLTYVIEAGHCYIGGITDTSLSIQPGTIIKFGPAGGLKMFSNNYFTTTITATGTVDNQIIFTSIKDDTVGGDTNNDGDSTSPALGDWELMWWEGTNTIGDFEYIDVRFARAGGASNQPSLLVDYGAMLMIRNSKLSDGEVGIQLQRSANVTIENSEVISMTTYGVLVESDGDVMVSGNRLENNGVGIYISKGHPMVKENFFQSNDTAVEVTCTPLTGDCAPIVSPHNRFVGSGQSGIINNYPQDSCVEARFNWWGDVSGPKDSSNKQDACQLVDNPGNGAVSSNGVDYSPWDGGIARPIIAFPGCGVTGRSQPTFTGRSYEGATIKFYDSDVLLGQTTATSDHNFSWTPTEPLSDRLHTITAIATFGDESSLPSPELLLTVDSTLPFDPAGVLISYKFHDEFFTQRLRDSSGCTSVMGDLDTPFWVRPGSTLSVIVPVRMNSATLVEPFERDDNQLYSLLLNSEQISQSAANVTIPITNDRDSEKEITKVTIAPKVREGLYGDHGDNLINKTIAPDASGTISIPTGEFEISIWGPGNTLIDRIQRKIDNTSSIGVTGKLNAHRHIYIENKSGKDFVSLYLAQKAWPSGDNIGGALYSSKHPIPNGESVHIYAEYPYGDLYHAILVDVDGKIFVRQINMSPVVSKKLTFDQTGQVEFKFRNTSPLEVCGLRLVRNEETPSSSATHWQFLGPPPNLLTILNRTVKSGEEISINLEPGRYSLIAETCDTDGKIQDIYQGHWLDLSIPRGYDPAWCNPVIQLGDIIQELSCPNQQFVTGISSDSYTECYAADIPFSVGDFIIRICLDGVEYETHVGQGLIDPDGFVYDVIWGIESVIPGATVTCDMYDEDYQSWERWPAELYEAQINPQVTGTDGYYAFFVPPGQYRVRATAPGYDPHTSPDIFVIDEIVHYNIPMTGGGGLYLPFVVR